MKNTIITLASVAALAGAANAQTVAPLQKFAFMSDTVYEATYNHDTSTWSALTQVASSGAVGSWSTWTDVAYDDTNTLWGYRQSSGTIWKQGSGDITTSAPTVNASSVAYSTFGYDGTDYYFGAGSSGPMDKYSYDGTSFTLIGGASVGSWGTTWAYDETQDVQYGYHRPTGDVWGLGSIPGTSISFTGNNFTNVSNIAPDGTNIRGFAAGAVIPAPVPEPSSTALLGLGGLALILRRRK